MRKLPLLLLISLALVSCQSSSGDKEGRVLAKVGESELYSYQLKKEFSEFGNAEDSLLRLRTSVNNWVREQLIIQKAKNSLNEEQLNFDEEVEDYYNSLMIYAFERDVLKSISDSSVSEEEIVDFYEQHKDQFKLNKPIIKYRLLQAAATSDERELKNWMGSSKQEDKNDLASFCLQYAYSYNLDDSTWFHADDALGTLPTEMATNINLSQSPRTYSETDSNYLYVLHIHDYLGPGKTSPLSFVREKVSNILQLRRKTSYLNKYYQELYDDAKLKKQFEIYVAD